MAGPLTHKDQDFGLIVPASLGACFRPHARVRLPSAAVDFMFMTCTLCFNVQQAQLGHAPSTHRRAILVVLTALFTDLESLSNQALHTAWCAVFRIQVLTYYIAFVCERL